MKPASQQAVPPESSGAPRTGFGKVRGLLIVTGALAVCFTLPLSALVRFAFHSELYSYILLVPFISGYLVWLKRNEIPARRESAPGIAALPFAAGLGALAGYVFAVRSGGDFAPEDILALSSVSFVLLLFAACLFFLGRPTVRLLAFPLGFLILLTPMPVAVAQGVEGFLQQGSAAVAYALFKISGATVFYHDLVFQLPGISIRVAPECSGIHSSIVLFITSLLAGYMFLRSPWKRSLLAAAVLPLALLRNGFRVFTIGELCVHIGPEMINSYIHKHGGPLFFILSLVPFFLLLLYLMKTERRGMPTGAVNPTSAS